MLQVKSHVLSAFTIHVCSPLRNVSINKKKIVMLCLLLRNVHLFIENIVYFCQPIQNVRQKYRRLYIATSLHRIII